MTTSTGAIDLLKRFWWLILAFAIGGAVIGYIPEPAQGETESVTRWTATHTMLISSTANSGSLYSEALTFNQIQLFATVGEVPKRVAEEIGFDGPPAALATEVSVSVDQSTGAMRISSTQSTADRAVLLADTFSSELSSYLLEVQDEFYTDRITASLTRVEGLRQQVEDASAMLGEDPDDAVASAELEAFSRQYSVAFEQNNNLLAQEQSRLVFTTLESAQPIAQTTTSSLAAPGSRRGRALMGGFAGAAVGVALAFVLTRTDRKVRSREQVEQVMGMSAHVLVPEVSGHDENELVVVPDRHDPLSDAYRTLRSIITFSESTEQRADGRAPVVVVVSASPGDGKTSSSANLAAAFAETTAQTTIVNTDFRRPTLAKRLGVAFPAPVGLELNEIPHAPPELVLTPTEVPDLSILDLSPLRGNSPSDLAHTTSRVLPRIASVSDFVVVDTSPIGATAEVLDMVPLADYVVLVVRLGNTTIQAARRSMEMITALSTANVMLAIVGGNSGDSGYYYYYSSDDEQEASDSKKASKESGRLRRKKPSVEHSSVSL